ncbi:tetratricopeptide repeat protein [Nocardia sp. CA-107356]|uniref:tetratricopeptide repeat protein n=1 Tax=Nocardia sp. CA-107356 TaxID=3239972 RepID=UPI003D93E176
MKGTASGTAATSDEADPVSLMEDLLLLQEQCLGHDHPDTNETRDRLADAYHRAGRGDDEVPLLKQLLAYRERVLGHDHHDTNVVHNRLGGTYMSLSRWDEAIPHFEQLLAYREKCSDPRCIPSLALAAYLAWRATGRADMPRPSSCSNGT